MFSKLSTRLTVLYAAMFGAVLLIISAAVFLEISSAAQRPVRMQLAATGTVFDRVWTMRSERFAEGATLLSRDFGFRKAAASRDAAAIGSAVVNLRRRMGVDLAFMVDTDGRVIGANLPEADRQRLVRSFAASDDPSGVFLVGGQPFQMVSAPVLSPELMGWVVIAVRLDGREMRALEQLSAIPLTARVLLRSPKDGLSDAVGASGLTRTTSGGSIHQSLKVIDVALSVGLTPIEDGAVGLAIERAVVGLDQARAAP
jgi:hypothetical protein